MAARGPSVPASERETTIEAGQARLPALLAVPHAASGIVIFAHGSGSSRLSPRNAQVAARLREAGLATLLLDLLTEAESQHRKNVFDIPLLASRLRAAAHWARANPHTAPLLTGLFGASTGAAAALIAAADDPAIRAVVSRGGRPDLAGAALTRVRAPTLLIVGELDDPVVDMNRQAHRRLAGPATLEIIPGATHLFEEPGALERAADLAADWFAHHLTHESPPANPAANSDTDPTPPQSPPPQPLLGFRDRTEAGEILSRALDHYRDRDAIVLALPRGGVEVGAVIARHLNAPLDVLIVRKLPAPPQPELALGALAATGADADPIRILDDRRIKALALSDTDIERIVTDQLAEIRRRQQLYRGARPPAKIQGRAAIVIDDGVATGSTAEAALRAVRAMNPAHLIFAAPVGAPDAIKRLAQHCDHILCPLQPEGFCAVGAYYAHFAQTPDSRVIQLLRAAAER